MKLDTLIVKGIEAKNNPNKAVIPPIFLASTFVQDDLENFQEFAYSRGSNPTKKAFDEIFAKVEGSKYAFSFGSGMAATAAALSLIKTGQKVLLNSNVYGGTYRYVTSVFESHGIKSEFIDDLNFLSEDDISDDVAAIFIETPSNPLLRVTDIARISKIAHKKGALVIVDNTFLTPYYQRVLDHGADIVVYSATKYIGGHADVIAGIVTLNDDALAEKIKFAKNTLGGIISPMDAYYLIRGLKTLSVRFDRQTQNTHKIIKFLQNNDAVSVVHFAGSYSEQEAKMQAAQANDIGALISFELDEKYDVNKFVKSLEIFDLAVSLGGVESLICRPATMTHEAYPKEVLDKIGIKQNLLRLAIGIENADDLIADLDQAFKKAKK